MAAQVTYGLGFVRSLYGWKAKKITFQMVLVPGPSSFGVKGKNILQVGIQNLSQCCATAFWFSGPCILLRPIGVAPRGSWPPLRLLIQPPPPPLGFEFCLVHFYQEQDVVLRLWNPTPELNQLLSVIWLLLRALACIL